MALLICHREKVQAEVELCWGGKPAEVHANALIYREKKMYDLDDGYNRQEAKDLRNSVLLCILSRLRGESRENFG
ncbi:hypothetical protein M514_01917 [Trichuris suis]|uniref:Uncharacterized protein n=1 Tax=Trichuris suis TaxID=68888 RepID=A0A085NJA5_9BILA|nr:hypothetical protein M513_01917 [Trichuris suis]KFD69551.1 hypothetical protein M514_01917 [Trichuris suis]